ncbi:MAG: NADH-quinone oxidoreductase subunit, partial [Solirubrobacterales bacterium]|nr:NADH-quinone oxidoreductase subunit [Solirubrobacterales bacterium]
MTQVYLVIGAPFVAAVIGLLGGRVRPRIVVPLAVTGATLSLLAALVMAGRAITTDGLLERSSLDSVSIGGGLTIGLDLRLDGLAALVSVAVAVVALAVQVYSTAYLKGDPRYSSYAAFVSLFTAAMMLVVFADDLFVLLVGWEVMGVCSYFLIGHHWEQEDARAGAVKAFVVTRLGDVGFLFGIFAVGQAYGTFSIQRIVSAAAHGERSGVTITVATLL